MTAAKPLAHEPLAPISRHGIPRLSRGHDAQAARIGGIFSAAYAYHEELPANALAATLNAQEFRALEDATVLWKGVSYFFQIDTARRLRPLRRRLEMMLRPPFVFMRARNPCVRRRLRLWGW